MTDTKKIPRPTRLGRMLYWFWRAIVYALANLILRIRLTNRGRIPLQGGLLVCCNHMSHLDPPLIAVIMPRMIFHMAKRELFRVPALTATMRAVGTILVDRGKGRRAIEDSIDYCKAGRAVVIFPEGTRSLDGRLKRGRSGAIAIAMKSGVPILPVALWGTDKAMPKGGWLIKPAKVHFSIGQPYVVDYSADLGSVPREFLENECYRLMEQIEAMLPPERRPTVEEKQKWYGELAGSAHPEIADNSSQVVSQATE